MKAKNSLTLYPLSGNADAIKDYADTIARFCNANNSNAYVMAFDDNNEILWCVQAGDEDSLEDCKLTSEVARVEIYDHSPLSDFDTEFGGWKFEQVYLRAGKRGQQALDLYLSECAENGISPEEFENRTKFSANFAPSLF